jgi:hypothetical protein
MIAPAHPVTFRRCQAIDYSSVAPLWTRINRELAPIGKEKLFEQYIAMTIDDELKQLPRVRIAAAPPTPRVSGSLRPLHEPVDVDRDAAAAP